MSNIVSFHASKIQSTPYELLYLTISTDSPETTWWRAKFKLTSYVQYRTSNTRPYTYGWRWEDRYWDCEIAPGQTFGECTWTLSSGEQPDTNPGQYSIVSFQQE